MKNSAPSDFGLGPLEDIAEILEIESFVTARSGAGTAAKEENEERLSTRWEADAETEKTKETHARTHARTYLEEEWRFRLGLGPYSICAFSCSQPWFLSS